MDLSSQEGEIPIPINSSYGHGHMIHHDATPHNHIIPQPQPQPQIQIQIPSSNNGSIPTSTTTTPPPLLEDHHHVPYKKMIRYRECLKNHAASMGGNATDGCGEFMPSGLEGTLEALTCSVCNCHRNFHRKEIEGEPSSCDCFPATTTNRVGIGRKFILGHHHHHKNIFGPDALAYPTSALIPTPRPTQAHQMIMSYNLGSLPSESDEQGEGGGGGVVVARPSSHQLVKKRFRTKFSQEQREKMLNFAEKVGWKIQKQEESVVQQFCQEIGVKRRVLKVWMHNNKHNLAKKSPNSTDQNPV
ncbi:zinc-finger homeodomain protein 4-like [Camellia sinensis]|uniref:ZF-HD dimerization-type domain-containing protein n=1 Tax=Camellia sinensis var. sinensis TaxID=542762 RepID=A0A4S4DPD0_CAMSN|nr:zinc-finger homeodomain protein 4-like [Camellia sinensis]THG04514.1 hypothetical protein TEA_010705 [Camellia sinensis var. sinensis]